MLFTKLNKCAAATALLPRSAAAELIKNAISASEKGNLISNPVTSLATITSPASAPSTSGMTNFLPAASGYAAVFTANTTFDSKQLTGLSSISGLVVGQTLYENTAADLYPTSIPLGSVVVSIDSASQITISKAATATTSALSVKAVSEKLEIIGGVGGGYAGNFRATQHHVTKASPKSGAVGWAIEFMTDAANVTTAAASILVGSYRNGSTPNSYRVAIDDVYQTSAPQTYGAADDGYLTIQFSTPGIHKVRVEFPSMRVLQNVYAINGSRIWKPEKTSARVCFFGDSYFGGGDTNNNWIQNNIAYRVGEQLGWLIDLCSQSGTGYVHDGGTNYAWRDAERHFDVGVRNYDAVVMLGSVNDSGYAGSPATVQDAALKTWRGIRSYAPTVPIFIFGCPTTVSVSSATATLLENALFSAFQQWSDPNAYFFPITTDGSGNWIDANNVGLYIGPDNTHLTNIGCQYFASKMIQKIKGALI